MPSQIAGQGIRLLRYQGVIWSEQALREVSCRLASTRTIL